MEEEDQEWIAHTLMDFERKLCISKVLKFDCKDAVAKGNNYISDTFRLNLKLVLNSGECEDRSYIYKIIPREQGFKLPDIKKSGLFRKEATVYREVLPQMEKLLKKVEPDSETFWPIFYGVQGNLDGLLMEDVSRFGYRMGDRAEGMDLDHISLALTKLAKFHALAAVLIERGDISKEEFDVYHFIKDQDGVKRTVDDGINGLVKVIEEHWKGEWLEYVEGLKKLKETLPEKLLEIHRRDDKKFYTLNHGDFWVNNVMFKYDAQGKPNNIKVVDYQLIFYNSPCFDLHYIFNTSLRPQLFDRKPDLLKSYHSSLLGNLKIFEYSGRVPTFEEFMESYVETRWFGYNIALSLKPFLVCTSVEGLVKEHMGGVNQDNIDLGQLLYWCQACGNENVQLTMKSCLKELKANGDI